MKEPQEAQEAHGAVIFVPFELLVVSSLLIRKSLLGYFQLPHFPGPFVISTLAPIYVGLSFLRIDIVDLPADLDRIL